MVDTTVEIWCPVGDMDVADSVRVKALEDCNRVNKVCAMCPQRIDLVRTIMLKRAAAVAECDS